MLEFIPEKRISTKDALTHPFFKDVGEIVRNIYA
jgi:hypothetical protein